MSDNKRFKGQEQLIYDRLFDVILEQKLQPGDRLTETPLSEIFGVSRTIVRKVLLRLSLDGVVEIKPNQGASVVVTATDEVSEFFEARREIEQFLASKLTGNLTQYQEETLRSLVRDEERLLSGGNLAKGLRKSAEFHFYLADIAGNRPLAEMARQLIARTSLIVAQYNLPGSGHCACVDHNQLIDALLHQTPKQVAQLMQTHIQHIEQQLSVRESQGEPDLYALLKEDGDREA